MLLESITAAVLISGANYADLHTTRNALTIPGAREINPIIGSNGERLELVKVAAVTGEMIVFHKLYKSKRKKLAWVWVATVVGTNLVIAHRNSKYALQSK